MAFKRIDQISDPYVEITGNGEGNREFPWSRMYWYEYQIPSGLPSKIDLNETEWFCIECFKMNARELLNNIDDLKLPRMLGLSLDRGQEKTSIESNIFPGKHRAKSLFMDFRHFTLTQDPSNFGKVAKLIKRLLLGHNDLQNRISNLSRQFQQTGAILDELLLPKDLLDVWFYSEYFHRNSIENLNRRNEILSQIYEDDVIKALVYEVVVRSSSVKSLYIVLKDLTQENRILNIHNPDLQNKPN